MKEVNKPEEKKEEQQEKPKRERRYISSSSDEINDLINSYRAILKKESSCETSAKLFKEKIEELERELRFRSKLTKNNSL